MTNSTTNSLIKESIKIGLTANAKLESANARKNSLLLLRTFYLKSKIKFFAVK